MVRRTKAEAAQTRQLILDTAEEVFFQRGVARTSLAEIAQAAGLTRGAIYWHFANKLELFDAMHERIRLPFEESLARALQHPHPLQGLRELCIRDLRAIAQDPHKQRVLSIILHKCEYVDEMGQVCERMGTHICSVLQVMTDIVHRAQQLGQLALQPPAEVVARALHNFILGTISDWLWTPLQYDLAADAESMVDLFMNGLSKPTPAVQ